jgi:Raf kinase inhibitor-like YbhB/YbcL family protein
MRYVVIVILLVGGVVMSCRSASKSGSVPEKGARGMALTISSTAFLDGAAIPRKFTCDGQDLSPPLAWSDVPAGAQSLALICNDPDAPMGTWTHWVLWNIPPGATSLPEGLPKDASLPSGMKQGLNSWPRVGYNGPCPPPGKPHHYVFTLYALDNELDLPAQAHENALENALKGHVLAQAQLVGMYGR